MRLLAKDGAKFTASGTYTRHILERLNVRRKRNSWNLLGFLMVLVFVTVLGAGCERGVASAPAPPAPTVEVTRSLVLYQHGGASYLQVLANETNYFSAELNLVQAQLNERLALVQLYQALGGGWQQ